MKTLGALSLVVIGFGACGDNDEARCPLELFPNGRAHATALPPNCTAAMLFASRDTPTLTPSRSEIDRYVDRWSRVAAAEPILSNRAPQRHRSDTGSQFDFETTNAAIIATFSASPSGDVPTTGDPAFDQIMSELVAPQLSGNGTDNGNGTWIFAILVGATFNEELLATRLLATASKLPDAFQHLRDDGVWSWPDLGPGPGADDAAAQIDFSFGWGDCFVTCIGMHDLRAIVPATGAATVFDLGGDMLPPELVLSPNTRPL